ncbi:hypothetical protein FJT64_025162 [Amphibalanus amphitrite]|uniref:Uncharacterized protein n=1 Tax=Amphibalanus amphitrite TaxID=1232801 RepID=A0A6A4W9Q1_AMPAM|nr:hypothetical protein FJT64_025162 [Amphibalanus amphitrite]
MSPSRIIEHHRRQEASKTGSYSLMKVSSQPLIDRYTISWSAAKLDGDRAREVAERVVTSTLRQAESVYSQLMEGSSADLTLLTIGSLDKLEKKMSEQLKRRRSGTSEVSLDHVHFSERNIVCPRPLESNLQFSELKTVANRPPTPIPSEEHLRIVTENQQLVDEITIQSEKFLHEKMKEERISSPKDLAKHMPLTPSLTDTRDRLKTTMMEKLSEMRHHVKKDGKYMSQIPESAMELIPRMDDTRRESFVGDMAKLVSDIIGTTMKQAETIMKDAIQATRENLSKPDGDDGGKQDDGADDEGTQANKRISQDFKPVFGSQELHVDVNVVDGSLAAYSVRHSAGQTGHEDHGHRPPVSHLRMFFKQRASLAAPPTAKLVRVDRKRHSMPATLPTCMDPTQMHGRNSFLSLVKPDLQTVAEFRDKTCSQVEAVLRDHSAFGAVQIESPPTSDGEDEELLGPPKEQSHLPPALVVSTDAPGEALDQLTELPAGSEHSPRMSPSLPVYRRTPSVAAEPVRPTHSVTASRMLITCDSDPRLSLRTSTAELSVDLHGHSMHCIDHEAEGEPEEELRRLESSALGFGELERTSSEPRVEGSTAELVPVRRSGSADGGPLLMDRNDSDNELELRVRGNLATEETEAAEPDPAQ